MEYERVKDLYLLKLSMLKKAKDNMRILHPLPRVNEIEYAIDDDPHAYYFEQAHNGLVCAALSFDMRRLGADLGRCDERPDDY